MLGVDAVLPSLTKLGVQAAPVALVVPQGHPGPNHVQEPVHHQAVTSVTKQGLLASLAQPLVDHTELEVVHQHVLVIVHQEGGGDGADDGLDVADGQLRGTQSPSKGQGGQSLQKYI